MTSDLERGIRRRARACSTRLSAFDTELAIAGSPSRSNLAGRGQGEWPAHFERITNKRLALREGASLLLWEQSLRWHASRTTRFELRELDHRDFNLTFPRALRCRLQVHLGRAQSPACGRRLERGLRTLEMDGGTLYVAGDSAAIGGVPRGGLAAVELSTGATTAWDPQPDGPVTGIDPAGGQVYVCGPFLHVGGPSRSHVACLDATNAQATAWAPAVIGDVMGIAVSDARVYLCGSFFVMIGGQFASNLVEFVLGTAQPRR